MIGFLKGEVKYILKDSIIIDCNSVGYRVNMEDGEFKEGSKVELFVYTHVRENEISLYGFKELDELNIFELLIGVSGVGPKVASSLVNELGYTRIVDSVLQKDAKGLKIKGVGIRTADKIILELKNKLSDMGVNLSKKDRSKLRSNRDLQNKLDEACEALETLGYSNRNIEKCISDIEDVDKIIEMDIEELVRYFLKKVK